jgi:hypothetical protein
MDFFLFPSNEDDFSQSSEPGWLTSIALQTYPSTTSNLHTIREDFPESSTTSGPLFYAFIAIHM